MTWIWAQYTAAKTSLLYPRLLGRGFLCVNFINDIRMDKMGRKTQTIDEIISDGRGALLRHHTRSLSHCFCPSTRRKMTEEVEKFAAVVRALEEVTAKEQQH